MAYDALTHAAQIGLTTLGFNPGPADGIKGPQTNSALQAWQSSLQPKGQFDERTEKNLATLESKAQIIFRQFIPEAKKIAATLGCEYVAISGNRTFAEQDSLYAQGRTTPGKVITQSKAGQSNHNFAIAMDFGVFKDGSYLDNSNPKLAAQVHSAVGAIAAKFNLDWGGAWKKFVDQPHYEVKSSLTLAQKRARVLAGQPVLG